MRLPLAAVIWFASLAAALAAGPWEVVKDDAGLVGTIVARHIVRRDIARALVNSPVRQWLVGPYNLGVRRLRSALDEPAPTECQKQQQASNHRPMIPRR